jgi:ABC-type branched-subunit amino acid transport system permease subunit
MTLLSVAADVLWILALSIMASATRMAWRRMAAETPVPLRLRPGPAWRLKRNLALPLPVLCAFAVGLALLWGHRAGADTAHDVIFFGLRATLAAILALMHLNWLKGALEVLEAEGRLNR